VALPDKEKDEDSMIGAAAVAAAEKEEGRATDLSN
jgi:hypothetical protein